MHVVSLRRVMALMGYRMTAEGYHVLERGYHTEAVANRTLEFVWCLEPHCPASALDWDPSATRDSCLADVNNLAGFLSRKRPAPQLDHSYTTTPPRSRTCSRPTRSRSRAPT